MKLYFLNGAEAGHSRDLDKDSVRLGRELDNDICLTTAGVSRYHASLQRTGSGIWIISDLDSTNGTKVNGDVIDKPYTLKEGDVISMGDQNIRLGAKTNLAEEVADVISKTTTTMAKQSTKVVFHPSSNSNRPPEQQQQQQQPVITPVISIKAPAELPKEEPAPPTPPTPPPEPAKTDLSIFENKNINLFQKKKGKTDSADKPEKSLRRLSSNLLFYTVILALIAIFVSVFHILNQEKPVTESETNKPVAQKAPFVMNYVKEEITQDNIFRFSLYIARGKATFTIDDLKSQRHYSKTIDKVQPVYLENLHKEIEHTDFFSLEPNHIGSISSTAQEERMLMIADDYKLNKVRVKNTYAPNSFETIIQAIDTFASHYGLYALSMTPEAIMKLALDDFNKGEDLFRNWEANPRNLLQARDRFRMTVENLDQFQPKPEIWDQARKREQEAEKLRKQLVDDLNFEYLRRLNLNDFEEAKNSLGSMMLLLDQDSKAYAQCLQKRLELDRRIRNRRR